MYSSRDSADSRKRAQEEADLGLPDEDRSRRRTGRDLAATEERKRRRLARHLHDEVMGDLTSLSLELGIVQRSIGGTSSEEGRIVQRCLETVERLGAGLQGVIAELQPPMLEERGVAAALRWLGARFADQTEIPTRVRAETSAPRLPRTVEATLVRIASEALSNVGDHADARQVWITLRITSDRVRLTIRDDGVGFEPPADPSPEEAGGWGITGMRARAGALGGTLRIETAPGRGTRVVAELPR